MRLSSMNMHQAASQMGLTSCCCLGLGQLYICFCWSPGFRNKTYSQGKWEDARRLSWNTWRLHEEWCWEGVKRSKNSLQAWTQAHLAYYALLYCIFYKLKVCGNPTLSKSFGTMVPTTFSYYFVSLCHILVIPTIFKTFSFLLYLLWWSVINDFWCYIAKRLQLTEASEDG